MSEWFITDDDCLQCCRRNPDIDPDSYSFVQIISFPGHVDGKPFWRVSEATIDVSDFSDDDIQKALNFFGYEDLDDFVHQNAPDWNIVYKEDGSIDKINSPSYIIDYQLIAEMLFEMDALTEYAGDKFPSWNEAVQRIADITNLDLGGYKEHKKSLDERIREAAQKADAVPSGNEITAVVSRQLSE